MASESLCFSKATVSTRSCTPELTRCAATMAVEPPTEPAVWTRNMGLPTAPSAGAKYSSGIMTPSNMSGALPTTTASMSAKVSPASSSAASAASRTKPAIETSSRLGLGDRLADPDDCATLRHHTPSRTQTRFCCRHGPDVACATARSACPDQMALADSPMRMRPADIIGLAASAPPEGLRLTSSPRPRARARISSWCAYGACSSATSTVPADTPAFSPANVVDGDTVRSRAPIECVSMRWSMPVMNAGRSHHSYALSPAASTTAAAPSVSGGSACRRSGATS